MGCVDEDTVVDLLEGRLDAVAIEALTSHLDACPPCRALVAEAARDGELDPAPLTRGASVGRYVVLGPVGSGSMATVYAAYDPELDRKVALKLLRADAFAGRPAEGLGERLRREAKALARLSCPNVVAVYDVGRWGDALFLAMEFVEGTTLTGWLHERPRTRREILRVFRSAGEGLAAAHASGIVHRDFKPENVLIGRDGRVRVSDFGLARGTGEAPDVDALPDEAPLETKVPRAKHLDTRTGALVGTPAYMAPEQWAGGVVDERTDVFGFSVALFEALAGRRPYDGDAPETFAEAVRAGSVDVDAATRMPAWLRKIVLRGLRAEPKERWPSMRSLLDALDSGPLLTPTRAGLSAALVLAVTTTLLLLRARSPVHAASPDTRCTGAEAAWGELWTPAQQGAVRAAFAATKRPWAELAFGQVDRALADYRGRWIAMHGEVCVATRVRGDQTEALMEKRMACLDDRRREVSALASLLVEADGGVVDQASMILGRLPALSACANPVALGALLPPPEDPGLRAQLEVLRDRLAEAKALTWSGAYARAFAATDPLVRDALPLRFPTFTASALLLRGEVEHRLERFDEATSDLHAAAADALEARDDAAAADAWTLLVRIDGSIHGHRKEGETWGAYAKAAIARLGGDDEREATLLRTLATIPDQDGVVHATSFELLRRARLLYEKSREPQRTFYLGNVDETWGRLLFLSGKPDEALGRQKDVELGREKVFGAEHPAVAVALGNQGDCLRVLGRLDESLVLWNRAVALLHVSGGLESWARIGRAQVLRAKGDFTAALDDDRAAAGDDDGGHGTANAKEALYRAPALLGSGLDLLGLGRPSEALAPLERALELNVKAPGRVDDRARIRSALARALVASGGDRTRARTLAYGARDDFKPLADAYHSFYASELAALESWLAAEKLQ